MSSPPALSGGLAGRAALVTGASRGIGAAVARRLVEAGVGVVLSHHGHDADAAALFAELREVGDVVAVETDVSSLTECQAAAALAAERFGRLDILVNNAAITDVHQPWTQISAAEWDRVMAVNARGPFFCARACHSLLAESPAGRIVNISSVTFQAGQAGLLHYVASKGAVVGFTRALARELGPQGITVNAVAPGAIRTEMERELFPDQDERIASDQAELQSLIRRGNARDVASAVCWLASDDAGFISGQTVTVDGGWVMG